MLKFELSEQMVNQIGEILQGAPYRIAAPILNELQKQIADQRPLPTQPQGNGQELKAEGVPIT